MIDITTYILAKGYTDAAIEAVCSVTNGEGQTINMTELNIDKNTGDFFTKIIVFNSGSVEYLEERLNNHIADNVAHITSSERDN